MRATASIPEMKAAPDRHRLEFVEEASAMDSAEDLQAAIAANPQDLESRYALAIVQMVAGETELALQICLTFCARIASSVISAVLR